jgi:hypothetical protein
LFEAHLAGRSSAWYWQEVLMAIVRANDRPIIAAVQAVLIFPAALFMAALVVRNLQLEPAQSIVMWYSGARMTWKLWVLLLALPFAVFITGCATLRRGWDGDLELPHGALQPLAVIRAHPATLVVAATTLTAAGILAIVVLHMLAN